MKLLDKMTSRTGFRPGRSLKKLDPIKREIIKVLLTGPKRWIELENNNAIFSLARSTSILDRALKELLQEGIIEQGYRSHKNRPYFLSEDAKALRALDKFEQLFAQFRLALSTIDRYHDEASISDDEVTAIESLLYKIQLVFLKTMDVISNSNPVIKPYVKSWFMNEILDTMIEIYTVYQYRLPRTTQRAMLHVTRMITEETKTPNKSKIEELEKIDIILQMLVAHLYETPIQPQ